MIDVSKHILDTGAKREDIDRVNEENEWQKRLADLASLKSEPKRKHRSPNTGKSKPRISAHQQRAITRR
jgi:hypothetical protein